ncbi:MAG: outer membrane lipoprotein-sorting protein [Elusimicrobia bacterium]|nr:outer membrane lipoprotein-sorting protein [Elusimicrobiota bacterium]
MLNKSGRLYCLENCNLFVFWSLLFGYYYARCASRFTFHYRADSLKAYSLKLIAFLSIICSTASVSGLYAGALTGKEILKKVDDNYTAENRKTVSSMIVRGRRGTRTLRAMSWIQGTDRSFSEYLSPPREAGTKMLKLGDELWIYSPSTDRIIKIAGHMLRSSVMGSDLSYEDYMEDPKLTDIYEADLVKEEEAGGRNCFVIELTAKTGSAAYFRRRMWIDKERYLPLKEERYAKSGQLLKVFEILEVFHTGSRWYPKRMIFKDALSNGSGTEFIIESVEFNADMPEYIFSKASLKK